LTAAIFALTFWQIGFNAFLPVALVFAATMISLIFIDAEHMILPNVINFPLLALALLVRVLFPVFSGAEFFPDLKHAPLNALQDQPVWLVSLIGALLGALVGGGFLWLVGEIWKRLRGVEAMGLGDVKMMLAVGALLGWRLTLLSIFLGAFSGAVIGVLVISRQKEKDMQTQIPFGIFLGRNRGRHRPAFRRTFDPLVHRNVHSVRNLRFAICDLRFLSVISYQLSVVVCFRPGNLFIRQRTFPCSWPNSKSCSPRISRRFFAASSFRISNSGRAERPLI
jgi:Flp pilus assembly protein protease CpaA